MLIECVLLFAIAIYAFTRFKEHSSFWRCSRAEQVLEVVLAVEIYLALVLSLVAAFEIP